MLPSRFQLTAKVQSPRVPRLLAAAACGVFLLSGLAFVPELGLQNDEAYFAAALLPPRGEVFSLHIGRFNPPLMLLPYLGTLKSIIYRPMIRALGTGLWATRVPMVLAGTAGLWLFYLWLRRIGGERAAVIGCGLLATDALYLITNCFDWGPVALQHLLLIGGLLLVVKFGQEGKESALASGFFLFGLALWDKALAAWILSGIAIAVVLVFRRQIFAVLTLRRAGIAGVAVVLGALPLIVYNVSTGGATFRDTVSVDTRSIPHKALILEITGDGSGLFGSMTADDWQTARPHAARSVVERGSAALASLVGHPRHDLLIWAFGAALLLAPLARGLELRIILFALLTMAIAWCQMAVTTGTGDSVHHTILLWPFPQVVIAVSWAAASRRLGRWPVPILALVMAVLMGSGLAVMNEYRSVMVRNGGWMDWTDAIYPLSNYMKTAKAREIIPVDWGILDSLRLLNRGRLPLVVGTDRISKPDLTAKDREVLTKMVTHTDDLFVTHTKGLEFFEGLSAKLVRFAAESGYRQEMLTVIADSYGRPTFEVYRFVPLR